MSYPNCQDLPEFDCPCARLSLQRADDRWSSWIMTRAPSPRAKPTRGLATPWRRSCDSHSAQDHSSRSRHRLFCISGRAKLRLSRWRPPFPAPHVGRARGQTVPERARAAPHVHGLQKWSYCASRRFRRFIIWCRARCAHAPTRRIAVWRL